MINDIGIIGILKKKTFQVLFKKNKTFQVLFKKKNSKCFYFLFIYLFILRFQNSTEHIFFLQNGPK